MLDIPDDEPANGEQALAAHRDRLVRRAAALRAAGQRDAARRVLASLAALDAAVDRLAD